MLKQQRESHSVKAWLLVYLFNNPQIWGGQKKEYYFLKSLPDDMFFTDFKERGRERERERETWM